MVVKVARRRRSFKGRRRVRKSRPGRALKVTKVLNVLRTYDLTGSTQFDKGDALSVGAGYLAHITNATFPIVNYGSFGAAFRLSDLPDYTEYTNMFEQYRVNKVTLKITPMATEVSAGGAVSSTATQSAVIFHYCLDYDDAARPTASAAGVDALRQRSGYRMRNVYAGNGKPIIISFSPKLLEEAYQSGVGTAYQPKKSSWIDEGYPNVLHYGVKCITESVSGGSAMQHFFKVETRLHISLKGNQ